MTSNNQKHEKSLERNEQNTSDVYLELKKCPIEAQTLHAMIIAGYANLALLLTGLYRHGFKTGEVFSIKQALTCGFPKDLAKTMMNQCEGREVDKKKSVSEKTIGTKTKRSPEQECRLGEIIRELQARGYSEESCHVNILNLIKPYTADKLQIKRPQPSEVKELFKNFQYANKSDSLDLSNFKEKRRRGRYGRIFVIPEIKQLRRLFHVGNSDIHAGYYLLPECKTKRDFCDAIHSAWMEQALNGQERQLTIRMMRNTQGDSHKTLQLRNKRIGIRSTRVNFSYRVDQISVEGLLIRCRGGCWFELDLQPFIRNRPSTYRKGRYLVTSEGLERAQQDFRHLTGSTFSFFDHLRICGRDASTYSFIKP